MKKSWFWFFCLFLPSHWWKPWVIPAGGWSGHPSLPDRHPRFRGKPALDSTAAVCPLPPLPCWAMSPSSSPSGLTHPAAAYVPLLASSLALTWSWPPLLHPKLCSAPGSRPWGLVPPVWSRCSYPCLFHGVGGTCGHGSGSHVAHLPPSAPFYHPASQGHSASGLAVLVRGTLLLLPFPILLRRLVFCQATVIGHAYCEHMAVVKLACSESTVNPAYGLAVALLSGRSHVLAMGAPRRPHPAGSAEGTRGWGPTKAFSTWTSHLCHPGLHVPGMFSFPTHRRLGCRCPITSMFFWPHSTSWCHLHSILWSMGWRLSSSAQRVLRGVWHIRTGIWTHPNHFLQRFFPAMLLGAPWLVLAKWIESTAMGEKSFLVVNRPHGKEHHEHLAHVHWGILESSDCEYLFFIS